MLYTLFAKIHDNSLWLVSDAISYCVSTGELVINHNSGVEFTTRHHNSILHQFRKLELEAFVTPLDLVTSASIGYIVYLHEEDRFLVVKSKGFVPLDTEEEVIPKFIQYIALVAKYSRRKLKLCSKIFGAVTETNMVTLTKGRTIH